MLRANRKRAPNTWLLGNATLRHALNGMLRRSQLGLRARCLRNKSSHFSSTFPHLQFDPWSASRVGTLVKSGAATARIRDTGWRSQRWLTSRRAKVWSRDLLLDHAEYW